MRSTLKIICQFNEKKFLIDELELILKLIKEDQLISYEIEYPDQSIKVELNG